MRRNMMAQETQKTATKTEPRQNHRLAILAIAFILLNVLDAQLTLLAVENGATELNPIMRVLLAQPDWVFWSSKISWALVFTLALIIAARKWSGPVARILMVLVGAIGVICILNLVGVVL